MALTLEQRRALEALIDGVESGLVDRLRWSLLMAYAEDQYDSYLVQMGKIASAPAA